MNQVRYASLKNSAKTKDSARDDHRRQEQQATHMLHHTRADGQTDGRTTESLQQTMPHIGTFLRLIYATIGCIGNITSLCRNMKGTKSSWPAKSSPSCPVMAWSFAPTLIIPKLKLHMNVTTTKTRKKLFAATSLLLQ